jgi:hypothetical protein
MKILGVISFICIAFILSGCAGSSEPTRRADLEREFSEEFGFKPGTNTVEIKCRLVQVGDSWSRWMQFTYDSNTLANIVSSGFNPVMDEQLKDNVYTLSEMAITGEPSPNAPKWWRKPLRVAGTTYFKENPYSPSNSMPSFCFIWVDQTQGVIYAESHTWQ